MLATEMNPKFAVHGFHALWDMLQVTIDAPPTEPKRSSQLMHPKLLASPVFSSVALSITKTKLTGQRN